MICNSEICNSKDLADLLTEDSTLTDEIEVQNSLESKQQKLVPTQNKLIKESTIHQRDVIPGRTMILRRIIV